MVLKNILFVVLTILGRYAYAQTGGTCTIERTQQSGTCQTVNLCPSVADDIRNRRSHTRCGFQGTLEVVCCPISSPPVDQIDQTSNSRSQRISDQKCEEYSAYVYDYIYINILVPGGKKIPRKVDKCGHKSIPLVVGGLLAKGREFPHMVLIGADLEDKNWFCAGTLISDQFVLTAAHCLENRLYGDPQYVRLGDLDYERDNEDARPEDFSIIERIPHPQYVRDQRYNDIALLKMDRKATLGPYKRPACLSTQFDENTQRAIATGWGQTQFSGPFSSQLRKVILEKFTHEECNSKYAARPVLPNGILDESQLCAGSHTEVKDTCQGDSGGPLQVFKQNLYCMYTIVGITSFGAECGRVGVPGVYTRVYQYLDWIEGIVWA